MVDVIQMLKDILYKLGLIADYVIEYGEYGIWTYEKWANGLARMSGQTKVIIYPNNLFAWGSIYYANVDAVEYPFPFIEPPEETITVASPAASYWLTQYTNSKTASGKVIAIRPNLTSDQILITLNYSVEGFWKNLGGVMNLLRFLFGGGADVTSKENSERFVVSFKANTGYQHFIQRICGITERAKDLLGCCNWAEVWGKHNIADFIRKWCSGNESYVQHIYDYALSALWIYKRKSIASCSFRYNDSRTVCFDNLEYAVPRYRLLMKVGWLHG